MSKKDKAAKAEKRHEHKEKASVKAVPKAPPENKTSQDTSKATKGHLEDRQITLISKALADPTRMSVLRAIANGGATCGDLKSCTQVSAATLSHHMKELESAGLIETERKGRFLSATLQRKVWKSYLSALRSFAE